METDYQKRYETAMERVRDLTVDLAIAQAKLEGKDVYAGALREAKIDRQRKALNRLNRRVRVQRLQLRRLNEMDRGLTAEEWQALKTEFAYELDDDIFEAAK